VISLKIAKVLAGEISYRSLKKTGKSRTPSIFGSNIFGVIFYAFLSFSVCTFLLIPAKIPLITRCYTLAIMLIVLTAIFSLLSSVQFTSTFINAELVNLLRLLPLDDSRIFRTYISALLLYWGGLSTVFLFLPFVIVTAYLSAESKLPYFFPVRVTFAFLLLLFTAYAGGIALGAHTQRVRKSPLFRFLSLISWLFLFSMIIFSYGALGIFRENNTIKILKFGYLLPFAGMIFPGNAGIVSITESLAIALLAYMAAKNRIEGLFFSGELFSYREAGKKVKKSFRTRGKIVAMIIKDMKLLSREPRRLATVFFFTLLPILWIIPYHIHNHVYESFLTVFAGVMVGVMCSLSVETVYYVEDSGARVLYYLPLRRRDISLSKSITCLCITVVPSTILIALFAGRIFFYVALLAVLLNAGYTLVNSAITMRMLPRNPSGWNEYSLISEMESKIVRTLIRIITALAGTVLPLILFFVFSAFCPSLTQDAVIAYALLVLISGMVLVWIDDEGM